MDYLTMRRIEQAVKNLAREYGLDGDVFAEPVPPCGTKWQEWSIIEIRLDARERLGLKTPEAKELIKKMARSVVLSSSPDLKPAIGSTMQIAVEDLIKEIGGDEFPEKRVRWVPPIKKDKRIQRARRAARCG